jgi:Flp pilus assembly pilin Flp
MSTSGRTDRTYTSLRREEAQTMSEYAVVLGIITPIVVIAFTQLGDSIGPLLDGVRSWL